MEARDGISWPVGALDWKQFVVGRVAAAAVTTHGCDSSAQAPINPSRRQHCPRRPCRQPGTTLTQILALTLTLTPNANSNLNPKPNANPPTLTLNPALTLTLTQTITLTLTLPEAGHNLKPDPDPNP